MSKRIITTKSVDLVHQLVQNGQIKLATEFQRNAVWPRAAKMYLIDTIIAERPMPLFFFQRGRSAQTGKPIFSVVDGQQRLRAIFEYLDNRFSLSDSVDHRFKGKLFSQLPSALQERILDYDLNVEELSGYSDDDVKDVFVRMNKYVIKLSPQELRHAREHGAFYDFVEKLGRSDFWSRHNIFTPLQMSRMKAVEFSAELAILLIEGPQDKKSSVDLYYLEYRSKFPHAQEVRNRLDAYFSWIDAALPELSSTRFRKPVDLYGLVGALDDLSGSGSRLKRLNPKKAGASLSQFSSAIVSGRAGKMGARYLLSTSRQTDNIEPRKTRIEIIKAVLQDF